MIYPGECLWALEKNAYSTTVWWKALPIRSTWSIVLFKSSVSLLIFCQMFYLLLKVWYWSLQQLIYLSVFYVHLSIFVLYIWVLLILDAYIIVLPSCWVDYYIMTFFVSSDNFWLQVYLVSCKYSHTCSLLFINSM